MKVFHIIDIFEFLDPIGLNLNPLNPVEKKVDAWESLSENPGTPWCEEIREIYLYVVGCWRQGINLRRRGVSLSPEFSNLIVFLSVSEVLGCNTPNQGIRGITITQQRTNTQQHLEHKIHECRNLFQRSKTTFNSSFKCHLSWDTLYNLIILLC